MPPYACLHVPLFPLAARLRSEPELVHEALAIVEGNATAARVVAASRVARKAGIRPGMTLPQVRALQPDVAVRGRDPECERAAQEALLEVAGCVSPRLEDAGEGRLYADLAGLERRHPDAGELGRLLIERARRVGLTARAGIARSKLAARVAAELPSTPVVVPPGEEAEFLAPLPLARLSAEAQSLDVLRRWGLRTIGDLARLPAAEVASRLGPTGRELHAQSRGRDPRPLIPYLPPPLFQEGMDLEWPLVELEPFLFVARTALERLCRRLEEGGLACLRLDLSLRLTPDGHHQRGLRLPAPTRDARTLLTLVRLDLEAAAPGAPVAGFTLTAHPDRPREAQLSLLGPPALSPDRLATTLARLFALLGSDRAGSPRTVDGHRPERRTLVPYAPPPPPVTPPPPPRGRGLLAVRVLRPPLPLEVLTSGDGEPSDAAAPAEIRAAGGEETERRPRIEGRVRVASGPWALEEEWWSARAATRDYWDVELSDGGLYRIFRTPQGEWFADGIYD